MTATLLNDQKVHATVIELDNDTGGVENEVGRPDSDGWRDVVPEVEATTEKLRDVVGKLVKILGMK